MVPARLLRGSPVLRQVPMGGFLRISDWATKLAIKKPLFQGWLTGFEPATPGTTNLRLPEEPHQQFVPQQKETHKFQAISVSASFFSSASSTGETAEKGTDLRNPQTDFPGSSPLPLLVQMPGQQANPPPRHPTSVNAAASRGCETSVRASWGQGRSVG
jgi:hypothetical protein